MTDLEKKDEILKLLTKALYLSLEDDLNLTLRGDHVYVDYGCSQFAVDITGCSSTEMIKRVIAQLQLKTVQIRSNHANSCENFAFEN